MTDLKALRIELIQETRARISASVKEDLLIIQAETTLQQLEQSINRLVKKSREWYALWNPEYEHALQDHETFVKEAAEKETKEGSMGAPLKKEDTEAINELLKSLTTLYEEKERLVTYIEKKMVKTCPNVTSLGGSRIGAQLLSHAGSLERLATMPSSTLQLLGAETALFRHLKNKTKHRSPKYGLLFNHPLVQKVEKRQQGKAARALADKLSICAKVDHFKGEPVAATFKKMLVTKFTAW